MSYKKSKGSSCNPVLLDGMFCTEQKTAECDVFPEDSHTSESALFAVPHFDTILLYFHSVQFHAVTMLPETKLRLLEGGCSRAYKMAQGVKALAGEPDVLNAMPVPHAAGKKAAVLCVVLWPTQEPDRLHFLHSLSLSPTSLSL